MMIVILITFLALIKLLHKHKLWLRHVSALGSRQSMLKKCPKIMKHRLNVCLRYAHVSGIQVCIRILFQPARNSAVLLIICLLIPNATFSFT